MIGKQLCKLILFVLIGVLLFFPIQEVFMPDWNAGMAEQSLSGFAYLEKNTVDVVFIGPCHVTDGISTMKIYEDTGIRSYNLGTSGQSMPTSYFLLDYVLKTQSPRAVFLDVGRFFGWDNLDDDNIGIYRYIMDNLYPSETSFKMAMDYEKMPGNTGFLSALLPMSQFHTRWSELTMDDLHEPESRLFYSMGQRVMPDTAAVDDEAWMTYEAHIAQVMDPESNYNPEILALASEYFEKIRSLCADNNIELVLIKVPTVRSPYDNGWTSVKSRIISEMADEMDLDFYDMNDLGIMDPETDTSDGKHMNVRGAEKVGAWLGELLVQRYPDIDTSKSEVYDTALKIYRDVRSVAELESEMKFDDYLIRLNENKNSWSFAVAGHGDYISGLTENNYRDLENLGLKEIAKAGTTNTYAAIIIDGEVHYEELSDRYINYKYSYDDLSLTVRSASKYDSVVEKESTAIKVNNDSIKTEEGLLFVVWDTKTGLIVDRKSFATGTEEKTVSISSRMTSQYLRHYESVVVHN